MEKFDGTLLTIDTSKFTLDNLIKQKSLLFLIAKHKKKQAQTFDTMIVKILG
jgi:hypothetical protein